MHLSVQSAVSGSGCVYVRGGDIVFFPFQFTFLETVLLYCLIMKLVCVCVCVCIHTTSVTKSLPNKREKCSRINGKLLVYFSPAGKMLTKSKSQQNSQISLTL